MGAFSVLTERRLLAKEVLKEWAFLLFKRAELRNDLIKVRRECELDALQ